MWTLLRLGSFRNAYLVRGALAWVGVRLAAGFAQIADPVALQEAFILAVVGFAVYLDARRRDEDLFLANLGVAGVWIAAAALPLALILELVVP